MNWQLLRATLTGALILLAIDGGVDAGPFEDGEAAYKSGDYATAVRLLGPLANKATPPRNTTSASSLLLATVYRRTFP